MKFEINSLFRLPDNFVGWFNANQCVIFSGPYCRCNSGPNFKTMLTVLHGSSCIKKRGTNLFKVHVSLNFLVYLIHDLR